MSNRVHYIYIWKESGVAGSGLPFYVGQGKYHKNSKYKRAYEVHMGDGARSKKSYSQNKADKLARLGTPHVVEILHDCLTKSEANELEKLLISRLGRLDLGTGILTNLSSGGDFNPTDNPDVENKRISTIKSTEYRKKMSDIVKSRYENPEYRDKLHKINSNKVSHNNPIVFDGIEYESVRKLAKHLGIAYETLRSRIKLNIPLDKEVRRGRV